MQFKFSLKAILLTFLFFIMSAAYVQTQDEIYQAQIMQKDTAIGNTTFNEEYSFYLMDKATFTIEPQVNQTVKGEILVFWENMDLLSPAGYRQGQQINLIVTDKSGFHVADLTFFMTAGFSFEVIAKEIYTISFFTSGRIQKMLVMNNIIMGPKVQTIPSRFILSTSVNMMRATKQMKNIIRTSQTNSFFEQKINGRALLMTKNYLGYSICEGILLFIMTFVQLGVVRKMLGQGSTIV